jgi:Zn-dependent protease
MGAATMEVMDSGEISLHPPAPALPGGPPTAPVARPGENPFGEPAHPTGGAARNLRRRLGGVLAAIVAVGAKFWAVVKGAVLLLPKLKLLTTAGTALVSVAAYSLFFGWTFASAPMFVPFLGAVITAKSLGENALAEARVGLAGPILGTIGAAACLVIGEATNSDLFRALAYIGFFLNLFNLLPVVPLDGGRAMAAMAPWMWFIGLGAVAAMLFIFPNFILLIILLVGGMEVWRRWQARKTRSLEQAAYYRVAPRHRLLVGIVYVGLIVVLALGMSEAHILSSGGHSFGHL